jgi:hypothetical protein
MRKGKNEESQAVKEWLDFVKNNRDIFEKIAKGVERKRRAS